MLMASNMLDLNLVVKKNYICSFYIDFRFMFVMFPRVKICVCYQISSNLDDSRLRYGGITIFKMFTSAIN